MNIDLVATDMDGTLLDSKKRIPEGFFDFVKECNNTKFVIASGRQYYALKRDFEEIHDHLIYLAENGALIFYKDDIIFHDEIPKEYVFYCLDMIEKMPCAKVILCGAKSAYVENPDEHVWQISKVFCAKLMKTEDIRKAIEDDIIVKIAIYYRNNDAEEHTADFLNLPAAIKPVLSGEKWIDIIASSVSKGQAMKSIQERFDIEREKCLAFGDYFNDVELLQVCGESYCMENGHPDMFKYAKYRAPSNDENGVMQILKSGRYSFK